MKFLITGGVGFIGSAVIRHIIENTDHSILNIDKLTYAGNLKSLSSIENDKSGLIGLTRYIATYWAEENVRCNAMCPGGIENG